MPITRTVVHECSLVISWVSGAISFKEIQDSRIGLDTLEGFSSALNSLIILERGIDFSDMTSEELTGLSAGESRFSDESRGVVLACDDVAFGIARLFASRRSSSEGGLRVGTARTIEEALAALGVTMDQLPSSVVDDLPKAS